MISPLLSINFFRYQKISGKQKGSFTKLFVLVLRDKKFRQNRDAPPPSYAWKFSMKEFFWNTKVFSNEIFRYSETKTSTENRDTPPPPLSIKYFSLPEIFWNTEWFPGEVFSVQWDKKNREASLLPLETFRYQNSFETQKGSPMNFIGTVRQRFFNGVYWYPLLMHKIFRCTKFSETPKCSLRKFFGTVRQKVFDEEAWYPPLSDT